MYNDLDAITIIPFDQGTDYGQHDAGTVTTTDETQSIGSSVEFRVFLFNMKFELNEFYNNA